jgi:hypothetical protein
MNFKYRFLMNANQKASNKQKVDACALKIFLNAI